MLVAPNKTAAPAAKPAAPAPKKKSGGGICGCFGSGGAKSDSPKKAAGAPAGQNQAKKDGLHEDFHGHTPPAHQQGQVAPAKKLSYQKGRDTPQGNVTPRDDKDLHPEFQNHTPPAHNEPHIAPAGKLSYAKGRDSDGQPSPRAAEQPSPFNGHVKPKTATENKV